jgi:hypothetical protein
MNARVNRMVLDANRRDLDEIERGRYLDELGVTGHVAFGFYVGGFGDTEAGSLCNAAVIPSSVIFFDADETAEPEAELGRAPRDGLTLEAGEWRSTVLPQDFADAPWTIRSMSAPGAVDLRGRVVARWSEGEATFAFATSEGASEAVESIQRHLAQAPEM